MSSLSLSFKLFVPVPRQLAASFNVSPTSWIPEVRRCAPLVKSRSSWARTYAPLNTVSQLMGILFLLLLMRVVDFPPWLVNTELALIEWIGFWKERWVTGANFFDILSRKYLLLRRDISVSGGSIRIRGWHENSQYYRKLLSKQRIWPPVRNLKGKGQAPNSRNVCI